MNPGRWLIHLYPAAWRRRYAREFIALLEDRPARPTDLLDIAFGAWDARCFQPDTLPTPFSGAHNMTTNTPLFRADRWLAALGLIFVGCLYFIQVIAGLAPAANMDSGLLNGTAVSWILLPMMGLTGLFLLLHRAHNPPRTARWPRWAAPLCISLIVVGVLILILNEQSRLQGDLRTELVVYNLLMIAGAVALGVANFLAVQRAVLPRGIGWLGMVCAISWMGVMGGLLIAPERAGAMDSLLHLNILISLIANTLWSLSLALWLCAGDWLLRRQVAVQQV